MKKIRTLISIALITCCLSPIFAATASDENSSGVDRYAIFIGSNKGGKGRETLLYAGSDAQNFQKTMSEIGGLNDANSFVLIDPSKEKINQTLTQVSNQIRNSDSTAKRSEFIFYYSGHSDETSLLLGDDPYDYSSLKAAITDVPSDIHVVILDSCYSGNFIRTKGGQKRKPFMLDDSSVVTGHAYLSSSSDNEYSQESDEIESSYFTNAMITGLRGAADTSGDNKVTLNELYSYAFNDTLSKTESSKAGPQHPNFNITLVGSGDLVLSDISAAESMLSLSKEAKGKFIIRNAEGKLISEINKVAGQPIFMALPAGQYSAVIIDEYSTKQGYFILEKEQVYVLDQNSLSTIKRKSGRVRGAASFDDDEDDEFLGIDDLSSSDRSRRRYRSDSEDSETDELPDLDDDDDDAVELSSTEDEFHLSFTNFDVIHLSAVPGVQLLRFGELGDGTLLSFGILGSVEDNVLGLQASSLINITKNYNMGAQMAGLFNITQNLCGAQGAGLFNIARQSVDGAQMAGLFNITRNLDGAQFAGLFNIANDVDGVQIASIFNRAKKMDGIQIGLINIAEEHNGIAIGLFNFIKDGAHDLGMCWNTNDMIDTFFQTGTKGLFLTFGFSAPRRVYFNNTLASITEQNQILFYGGLGTRFTSGNSSTDLEFLWKSFFGSTSTTSTDWTPDNYVVEQIPALRISFNGSPLKHISAFCGINIDINIHDYNDTAFDIMKSNFDIDIDEDVTLHPSFFIGFKIR